MVRRIDAGPAFSLVSGQGTRRAATAPNGSYWMARSDGLLEVGGRLHTDVPYQGTALPSPDCRDLAIDPTGTIWVATAAGVARRLGGRFESFGGGDGLPSLDVRAVVLDAGNRPVVAAGAGVAAFGGVVFESLGVPPGDEARDLEIDAAGTLWVATDEGLASWDGAQWHTAPGTGRSRMTVVDSLPDGRVLAGSEEDGLYVVQASGATARYGRADGLPGDRVNDLYVTPGPEPEAWVATDGGLTRFVAEPEP